MPSPPDLITVSILDHDYQFSCPEDEREALRVAALYLDEKMREVKSSGSLMALERVAVMTALNISDELLKMRSTDKLRQKQVDHKIRMLADELDNALGAGID
ncbi:MAG: cell division protein ZapA [Lysobacterales bacterium]|jgi:cell division protein ZapA